MGVQEAVQRVHDRAGGLPPWARYSFMGACAAVIVGAAVAIVRGRPELLAALALAALAQVAWWLLRVLVRAEAQRGERLGRALRWLCSLPVGLVVLVVVLSAVAAGAVLGDRYDVDEGIVVYSVAIAVYVALGALLGWWRHLPTRRRRWGPLIVGVAAAVGVVSLVIATVNVSFTPLIGLVAALLVAPVGLALVAEDAAKVHSPAARWALGWGVAAIAAGLAGFALSGIGALQAVGLTLAIVVVVAAISSDTSHDIVLVVLAITLFWSLDPRPGEPLDDPAPGARTIVAIGDSYMSGEGARVYFQGTNHRGPVGWNECRRAPTAYPVRVERLLADAGEEHDLLFLACSGAKARQLTTEAQYPNDPLRPWSDRERRLTEDEVEAQRGQAQLPQAEAAVAALELDPDVVLVSIGGNDAAFGEIGRTCGLAGDCSVLGAHWLDGLARARQEVRAAYDQIAQSFPRSRVLVVPYPVPLNETGCDGSLLRPGEHRFVVGYTRALDRMLAEEADDAGFEYLSGVVDLFTRHRVRICDTAPSKAAVNQLAASPTAGVFLQQISPRGWFHNTFHPNDRGHRLIAGEVARWVDEGTTGPEPPRAATTLEGIMGEGFDHCGSQTRVPATCHADVGSWTAAALARLLWVISVPALLVTAGAVVCSVLAIRRWRGTPRPFSSPNRDAR